MATSLISSRSLPSPLCHCPCMCPFFGGGRGLGVADGSALRRCWPAAAGGGAQGAPADRQRQQRPPAPPSGSGLSAEELALKLKRGGARPSAASGPPPGRAFLELYGKAGSVDCDADRYPTCLGEYSKTNSAIETLRPRFHLASIFEWSERSNSCSVATWSGISPSCSDDAAAQPILALLRRCCDDVHTTCLQTGSSKLL